MSDQTQVREQGQGSNRGDRRDRPNFNRSERGLERPEGRSGGRPGFSREALDWKEDKRFERPGCNIIVSVRKAKRPVESRFSIFIGVAKKDGLLSPNITYTRTEDASKVVFKVDYAAVLAELLAEAQQYIQTELETEWAFHLEQRIVQEERRFGSEQKPQKTFRKGKTARDHGKRGPKAE